METISHNTQEHNTPSCRIQMTISCRNLKNLDINGKSELLGAVYLKNDDRTEWEMISKTETIMNSSDPDFLEPITINYYFQKDQQIRFEMYDLEPSRPGIQGTMTTKVSHLLGAKNQTFVSDLENKDQDDIFGKIIIKTDAVKDKNLEIDMEFQVYGLPSSNKSCLSKEERNPFVMIKRYNSLDQNEQADPVIVYQSVFWENVTLPKWSINRMKAELLCNSDLDLPLIFEVWNHIKSESPSKYGIFQTSINDIMENEEKKFKLKDDSGRDAGTFIFMNIKVTDRSTIIDYIRSGWKFSLSVAINFDYTNKELDDPESLHYVDPNNPEKLTVYEEVISLIGNALEPYKDDKKYRVYGFSAAPLFLGTRKPSDCFCLNTEENPEVEGVQGILQAYRDTMELGIDLEYRSIFNKCLKEAIELSKANIDNKKYVIKLIITNEEHWDFTEFAEGLGEAIALPMSVLIVGVGNHEFSELVGFSPLLVDQLRISGYKEIRRMIKFVCFNDFKNNPSIFLEEILKEVPDQMVAYMERQNILISHLDHLPV